MIRDVGQARSGSVGRAAPPAAGPAPTPPVDRFEASPPGAGGLRTPASLGTRSLEARARELEPTLGDHVPGELLVRLRPGLALEDLAEGLGARVLRRFELPAGMTLGAEGDLVQLQLPGGRGTAWGLAALEGDPRVAYAVPNHRLRLLEGPATLPDDLSPRLWGLYDRGVDGRPGPNGRADIRTPEAWETVRSSDAVVAILDTGIDLRHPDLVDNLWTNPGEIPGNGLDDDGNGVVDDVHGFNAVARTGDPMDDNRHGTHVAGTVGARGNNGQGVVGVNWGARMMGVKFLSAEGMGNMADAIAGLLYAEKMGARITSNSWGGGPYNQAMHDVLAGTKALHVFAAGNESNDSDMDPAYPASYELPNVLAVAATTRDNALAGFSNRGTLSVDVAAPGDGIYSTLPGGAYGSMSGTSMATPHVSGAAALLLARYPDLTNQEIKDRLVFGSDRFPQLEGATVSGGRLNLARSLGDDRVPPAVPGGLEVVASTPSRVDFRWTAPGDDGNEGRAAAFEVRVADRPLVDGPAGEGQISFDRARPLPVGPPGEPGTEHRAGLDLMPSARQRVLYAAVKAVDEVGNRSGMALLPISVPPAAVVFEDDGEGPPDSWTAEGDWGLQEVPYRGRVWSDSPKGFYRNDQDASLTSRPISLEGVRGATLAFEARHNLEITFDQVHLELTDDGGRSWKNLRSFNLKSGWKVHTVDLSAWEGKTVQIRFRLKTDPDMTLEGFDFDNLVIFGSPPPELPA